MDSKLVLEKYRVHVDHFDLTETQKTELIHIVYCMMENAVDRTFGDDAVQLALADTFAKDAPRLSYVIELEKGNYRTTKLTQTFNNKKGSNSQ